MPRHFWRTVVVFRRYRPPSSMKKKGSSSRELGSPPEFVVPASARLPGRLPWGLLPLRDVNPVSPRSGGHPRPTCVPPAAFRTLSTACSSLDLAGFFHPAATSRVLSVQGLLSPHSHPSSSEGACPLAVVSSSLHAPASTFAETNALPRAMPLGFEASICARPRSTSPVIHLARTRSPRQFRLLQVLLLSTPASFYSTPSVLGVRELGLRTLSFHLATSAVRAAAASQPPQQFAIALRLSRLVLTVARSPPTFCHREAD